MCKFFFNIVSINFYQMKKIHNCLFVIMIFCSSTAISQTYEVRRVDNERRGMNYGTTIPTTDLARYSGEVQSRMQAKYDYNYQKISDKLDDISSILRRLYRNGFKPNESQKIFLDVYREFIPKINKVNFTDNVAVSKVMSNLRYAEEEILTW